MTQNPVVMIHGYSAKGTSFKQWEDILRARGFDVETIHTCSYRTLTNEITIKDIAEGFDRALRIRPGLDQNQPFDAIVHSTGMLVVRAWLTAYPGRRDRLKRLIGLAPASFGSPLAHKGRSWLAALFRGNKEFGPDFLEAGDRVLDALELGSVLTWDLAHKDLIGDETVYGVDDTTPYVFTFCGIEGFSGLLSLVNEPGTDGTVRWAGCSLNTRKITLDLTVDPQRPDSESRIKIEPWRDNIDIPLIPIAGLHHGTIMSNPSQPLIDLVCSALQVSTKAEFDNWHNKAQRLTIAARNKLIEQQQEWQQFIVHTVDERNDPISDFYVQLFTWDEEQQSHSLLELGADLDVHAYSEDDSYRCFHLNLSKLNQLQLKNLGLRVIASSGSQLIGYHGFSSEKFQNNLPKSTPEGYWDAALNLTPLLNDAAIKFFYPLTTTLVELQLNREPLPFNRLERNEVCWFV